MSAQTRAVNQAAFQTGDKPQGADYANLIDSFVSLVDTTAQTVGSNFNVQVLGATEVVTPKVSAADGQFTTLSVVTVSGSVKFAGSVSFQAVAVSGVAAFADAITVSGSARLTGPLDVAATARFTGPIRMGAAGLGRVFLSQFATVASQNSAGNPVSFTIPAGSDLVEIYVDTVETWNAGSLGTAGTIEIGVSGSSKYFAVVPVSATGSRSLASSFKTTTIKRWKNFSGQSGDATGNIKAFVTAATQQATAMTVGETILTVVYVQNV